MMYITHRSDLAEIGRDEDGEMFIGHVYYVVANLDDGSRYAHGHRFIDTVIEDWEDEGESGWFFKDVTDEAVAKVEALAAAVIRQGSFNKDLWYRIDSEYGSAAFQADEATKSISELGHLLAG